jgi:hypothetical protein
LVYPALLRDLLYFLSAVNYDPMTTDLIFIMVNIYSGPGDGGGGVRDNYKLIYFIRVTIYHCPYPTILAEVTICPGRAKGMVLKANF